MDLQARDQRKDRAEEAVFNNAVIAERGLKECRDGISALQIPGKGQADEMHQEHARKMEQEVGPCPRPALVHEPVSLPSVPYREGRLR